MQDFKKLKVWKKVHQLNLEVYKKTNSFPEEEKFGLTSQIRRSAISISANIAERCGHYSMKEFKRYINMAFASSSELECLLLLSRDIELLSFNDHKSMNNDLIEIKKMLFGLGRKIS